MKRRSFVTGLLGGLTGRILIPGPSLAGPALPGGVVWSADHETGDLTQWSINGTSGGTVNSGYSHTSVSSEVAHSGKYSCKLTIDTSRRQSGCRQFRREESRTGELYYYSVWYHIPVYYRAERFWNVFQFKSKTSDKQNHPFWKLDILPRGGNGPMHLRLRWRGNVVGPLARDDSIQARSFTQDLIDVPVARWFHVEAYLRQSSDFTGRLTIWQDGIQLWDMVGVKTKYPDGDNRWSVNNYSNAIEPNPTTIYIDDAMVSTRPVHTRA